RHTKVVGRILSERKTAVAAVDQADLRWRRDIKPHEKRVIDMEPVSSRWRLDLHLHTYGAGFGDRMEKRGCGLTTGRNIHVERLNVMIIDAKRHWYLACRCVTIIVQASHQAN